MSGAVMSSPGTSFPIRIVVADDQELVRSGYRLICSGVDDLEIVGEASSGASAIEAVEEFRPDVVIMDIRMPGMDGLEATEAIVEAAESAAPHIVVITTFDDEDYIYRALGAGATSFLLKDATPEEIVKCVRLAAEGVTTLAPSVTTMLIDRHVRGDAAIEPADDSNTTDERWAGLTEREREVLVHVCDARSNRDIADQLFVSERTVKSHLTAIMKKLGVRTRVAAVVYAYENGLVGRS